MQVILLHNLSMSLHVLTRPRKSLGGQLDQATTRSPSKMKSLIEAAKNLLLEMAYERKRSMELIPPIASRLASKLVLLHHAHESSRDIQHWKTTTNGHLREIHSMTFFKKGGRIKHSDLHQLVVDEPFGEYDDYLRHYNYVKSEKSETELSPPSYEDYTAIKDKLHNVVSIAMAQKHDSPKYQEL